ncbi:AbrB/MazE/SpoVT family DNA-binding domain-containing protein [Candidatus Bathyarchaeota archaeon]|nr:AbrB/MazE/SpoVT family DNA-binding domain-containing protein [Candidatus Bathyarchaeota archaeon]
MSFVTPPIMVVPRCILCPFSLIVTLPKDWTRMNNVESGDEVTMKIQDDGSLAIHPSINFDGRQNQITLRAGAEEDVKMIQRKNYCMLSKWI